MRDRHPNRVCLRAIRAALCLCFVAFATFGQVINIHSTFGNDPGSEATVSWRGSGPSSVEYGTSLSYGQSATGTSQSSAGGTQHHVALTGLTPGTKYYYRCANSSGATGSFVTGPSGSPSFSFAPIGDVQENRPIFSQIWNDA